MNGGVEGNGEFRHGVASGDPLQDQVVIWTRVSMPTPDPVDVTWTVARDPELSDVVGTGNARAHPEDDFTVHVDVDGLEPDRHYWYGFDAAGSRSPVGRTRTLPAATDHLRFAIVSCAKFNAGFLNGYARVADREDLQFLLHLGDYIYEASQTPPASQTPGADIGRPFEPRNECVTLGDYRTRYAQYRRDPDVQRVHHTHPIIGTVDDHEMADGAWRGGSTEHRDERDGPWDERKHAAFRARWEWMPYRMPDPADPSRVYQTVALGPLADVFLIDTRSRRDEPIDGPAMADPSRSQLGAEQFSWLVAELRRSEARWRFLGNGSVIAHIWTERLPPSVKVAMVALKATNPDMTGPDPDQWDGYPAERQRIFDAIEEGGRGDVVVLSGDLHIGMANELYRDPFAGSGETPLSVEFVTTSLTSQNVDDKKGWPADTRSVPMEQATAEALPHMQWCDFDGHGYALIDVTPDRVRGEFWFVDAVLERVPGEKLAAAFEVERGTPRLVRIA